MTEGPQFVSGAMAININSGGSEAPLVRGWMRPVTVGWDKSCTIRVSSYELGYRMRPLITRNEKAQRWQLHLHPDIIGDIWVMGRHKNSRPKVHDLRKFSGYLRRIDDVPVFTIWTHRLLLSLSLESVPGVRIFVRFHPYRRSPPPRRGHRRPATPPALLAP